MNRLCDHDDKRRRPNDKRNPLDKRIKHVTVPVPWDRKYGAHQIASMPVLQMTDSLAAIDYPPPSAGAMIHTFKRTEYAIPIWVPEGMYDCQWCNEAIETGDYFTIIFDAWIRDDVTPEQFVEELKQFTP